MVETMLPFMLAARTHIYSLAPLNKTIFRMQWALPHVLARVCQHVNPNESCGFPQQQQSNKILFNHFSHQHHQHRADTAQSQLNHHSNQSTGQQYTCISKHPTNHSIKFHCAHYTQDGLHTLDLK